MTVTAAMERLTFDGLEFNDDTLLGLRALDAPAPRQRADWVGSADSEHQALFRDPLYENRTITCRVGVAPQSTMDAALDQLGLIRDKLAEASKLDDGLTLVWRPANSTRSVTFDVLAGEIVDMPIDWENGWLVQAPTVTIVMTAKPYWRGVEFASVTDPFSSNTITDYTFDAGAAGNVSITGGVMDAAANLTTENRLYHSASPYSVTDSQETVKHTLGTTLTSYKAGVILKRIDASNYLEAYVDDTGAASRLRIDQVVATARTNLVSAALTRMTISTSYWVRARINGNVVIAEHWTAAPTATTSATTTTTATLAGAGATALGFGVQGRAGLVWTPQQTAAALDDLEIAPHVTYSGTAPITELELPNVPGDVAGTVRLVVTNRSGTDPLRYVEWGEEQRGYTPASPAPLVVDSDSLVTSGFSGAQTTRAGAYDPNAAGNSIIRATLYTQPTVVCGTGTLAHVGRYRVSARGYASGSTVRVRLSSRAGEGGYLSNAWTAPVASGAYAKFSLGVIDIPAAVTGSQAWDGRIEAYSTDESAPTVDIDYIELMPESEGRGISRAQVPAVSGILVGSDDFTGTTAAANLNTRAAPIGGTWATSGAATDFVFSDGDIAFPSEEHVVRAAAGTRYAILGATNYTDVTVQSEISPYHSGHIVARWTDSSNYLVGRAVNTPAFAIAKLVAGVETVLATQALTASISRLVMTVDSAGQITLVGYSATDTEVNRVTATDSALAAGGTLATGKPGFLETGSSGPDPAGYDSFRVITPPTEIPAAYAGRRLEVRSDTTLREASAGGTWGREQSYRGARPLAPAEGTVGRTARLAFQGNTTDLTVGPYTTVTASYAVQAIYTPRGLAVPR